MGENIKLDELQLKIMKVLWEKEEATVIEIQDHLSEKRVFAITTISTILTRLAKKEIVKYRKQGRQYIYTPLVSEGEVKESMSSKLIDQFFKGKSSLLVNHLLKEKKFKKKELDELRKLIDEASKKKK